MTPMTLNKIWLSVQRLPAGERKLLNKMLTEMNCETEEERKTRTANSIDMFFGGWCADPRDTATIKEDIMNSRTNNSFFE